MARLEEVWLILPFADADDEWEPASVFSTWEQAVACATENGTLHAEMSVMKDCVRLGVGEGEYATEIVIVAVPIEYPEEEDNE